MRRAVVFAALLVAVLAGALCAYWALSSGSASSAGGLTCSVKSADPGCDTGAGEVAVFRMSSTSNAQAGTPGGSAYGNVVCCGGVTGLGTSCSGNSHTVLTLSATDNAHVGSGGTYPTEICLSAESADWLDCIYGASCATDYACLATISGSTNAHVADCDGTDDYATKVCCYVGDPLPVGGIAELPEVSGSRGPDYMAQAGLAAAVLVLTASAWYARRRWLG